MYYKYLFLYLFISSSSVYNVLYTVTMVCQGSMTYVYYGSLALLLWKCGTQLMSEMKYKPLKEEEDLLLKQAKGMKKTGKFQNVFK